MIFALMPFKNNARRYQPRYSRHQETVRAFTPLRGLDVENRITAAAMSVRVLLDG